MVALYDKLTQAPFFLIAGPCVIEDEVLVRETASEVKRICEALNLPFVFKSSFRKANRTRLDSYTGPGDASGLAILARLKSDLDIYITTDVHESTEIEAVAAVADIIQIPAFLSRQTQLLETAAGSQRIVNVKKGQFLSPDSMRFAVEKIRAHSDAGVLLTERGTSFGYNDLVVDFTGIPIMKSFAPVVMDCTHSLQRPNQEKGVTGGRPELIETMAKAALAVGVDGLFIETHPSPQKALSDGANMLALEKLEPLMRKLVALKTSLDTAQVK